MRPGVREKTHRDGPDQIYFIKHGKRIKIGVSGNPRERLKDIAIHLEGEPKLLGCIKGTYQFEKYIHSLVEPYRKNGEWFEDCHAVRETMGKVLTGDTLGYVRAPEQRIILPPQKQRTAEEQVALWNFIAKIIWPENHEEKFAATLEIPVEESRSYFSGEKMMPKVVSMALGSELMKEFVRDIEERKAARKLRKSA